MATILCVDDEPSVGVVLEHTVTKLGHRPILVSSVEDAIRTIARTPVDLVIADYVMPKLNGLDLLRMVAQDDFKTPVIIMTEYSSIENAVISIKSGAIGYITKPIRAETFEITVTQALEQIRLRKENETLRSEIQKLRSSRALVGESESFRRVTDVVATIAPTRANVLLQGESGTGKRLFARAIHDQSVRAGGPFVTINCAAIPEGLVESAFGQAHGGTLLLDQITEMRIDLQAQLLGAMQEQADVRLIGTTNRDLKAEVDAGRFRDDLYYRLNLMPIRMPPLRERIEDIPRLVHHFLERVAERLGTSAPTVAPETIQTLQGYGWPGNVRELSEAIERAAIHSRNGTLLPSHLGGQLGQPAAGGSGQDQAPFNLDQLERIAIARALVETRGNRTRAAKLLGISERTLRNKLNRPKATMAKG